MILWEESIPKSSIRLQWETSLWLFKSHTYCSMEQIKTHNLSMYSRLHCADGAQWCLCRRSHLSTPPSVSNGSLNDPNARALTFILLFNPVECFDVLRERWHWKTSIHIESVNCKAWQEGSRLWGASSVKPIYFRPSWYLSSTCHLGTWNHKFPHSAWMFPEHKTHFLCKVQPNT